MLNASLFPLCLNFCSKEDIKVPQATSKLETLEISRPLDSGEKRKRGRPTRTNAKRGRVAPKPYRRMRARIGNHAAKINSDEHENSDSVDESDGREANEPVEEIHDADKTDNSDDNKEPELRQDKDVEDEEMTSYVNLVESDNTNLETLQKRNRGRPTRTNAKRGRAAAPKPYKRTRARIGNSDSVDEADGREVNEPMELICDADKTNNSEDKREQELRQDEDAEYDERTSYANLVESDNNINRETLKEDIFSKGSEIVPAAETGKKGTGEKLEQMVDPLQAMLLDMIPTLSQKREGTTNSVVSVVGGEKSQPDPDANPVKKGEGTASSIVSVVEGEKSQPDPGAKPVKKKVSYKDMADELLKDW